MTTYEIIASVFAAAALLGGGLMILWKCAVFYKSAIDTRINYEQAKDTQQHNEQRIANLLKEIEKFSSTLVVHGFIFLKEDPLPKYPLCPVCYAKGLILRMCRNGTHYEWGFVNGFKCINCSSCVDLCQEDEIIFEGLGHHYGSVDKL